MKIEPFITASKEFLELKQWTNNFKDLIAGFSTRQNGYSSGNYSSLNLGLHVKDINKLVLQNRKKIAEKILFPLNSWICTEQIHNNTIVKVSQKDAGLGVFTYESGIKKTDGIYTKEKNILLTSFYADCVPIYFISPKSGTIGLAHAGWKGTVKNIAKEMINTWTNKEKIDIKDIFIAIGPSIGSCCYILNDAVKESIAKTLNTDSLTSVIKKISNNKYTIDLKEVNKLQILDTNINEDNIITSDYCTSCNKNLFFSYRRDNGKTGRMMSFIGMKRGIHL